MNLVTFRNPNLRAAAPAMLLAGILLLPFIGKPFTIDDPLFLHAAEHVFVDPLHPADFEQVWNAGDRQRLSEYWLGGMLPAYVLAPVAALGSREWVAHLYQLLLLSVFLLASVSFAARMGCDRMQAGAVGLLIASNPVTLAMAATCMPDIMAAAFAMLGMDRVMVHRENAFRENRRIGAGVSAAVFLGLAIGCRGNTAMLLVVSAMWLLPGNFKRAFAYLWPLGLTLLIVVAILGFNRGRGGGVTVAGAFQQLTSLRNVPRNIIAFLCYQALTGPVLLYWFLFRGRRFLAAAVAVVSLGLALAAVSSSANLQQYAVPAALGICFAAAILGLVREVPREVPREAPHALPLALWLGSGLVAAPYVHMAAKYLLPGVPAAALLVVLHGARLNPHRFRFITALLIAAGGTTGILIVAGDTTLARSQRAAVDQFVAPRIRQGSAVWAGGQWAFLGYAQKAGARPLANTPPLPQPGDFIVVSRLDYYGKLDTLPLRLDLVNVRRDDRCGVFVMNRRLSAGFYSNRFGYLPFALGCTELNRYDVFRVLPWVWP